jgi:hypothetical protein
VRQARFLAASTVVTNKGYKKLAPWNAHTGKKIDIAASS